MAVHVVEHPLIRHKLGLMREHTVSTKDFRGLASELAALLCLFLLLASISISNRK